MECNGQVIEDLQVVPLVVGLHVVVQCFFVAEKLIVLKMVMDFGLNHLL